MSTLPARYDLSLWRGATFTKRFTLFSNAAATVPRDLTGYTARLRIVNNADETLLALANGTGITVFPETGIVDIRISDEQTLAASWSQARYEFSIESQDGETVEVLLWGRVSVKGL